MHKWQNAHQFQMPFNAIIEHTKENGIIQVVDTIYSKVNNFKGY